MTQDQRPNPLGVQSSFDYFGDNAKDAAAPFAAWSSVDKTNDGPGKRRLVSWRSLFKLLFIGFCAWFVWQYHDLASYSFGAEAQPLQLGDVTAFTPDLVPHNGYVCVDGISEHRGMTQQVSRVLGQGARPYWYFRLLGSRGIFVEVPPDAQRYSTTQAMHVCGRAVDPKRSPTFGKLTAVYEQMFATQISGPTRIIEAGLRPGTHRLRYSFVLCGLTAALGLQAWTLYRRWR